MENDSPSSAPRGDTNIANIGAGARVKQFAQGSNITQIEGYTAEQVQTLLAEIRASFQPKPFDGRSPYVGLASFQEQDADRFFGREKLTQELVARIETARLLVIAGPSGSGKSSLARAGLLHALRNGARAGSENWLYEILTPGRHPLQQLARVVSALAKSTNAGDEIQQRGRDDATLLHRWADIALGDQKTRRAILLVDQFEESFTQADQTERAAFFNQLLYAATIENGRVTLVVCTRSDFIGNWAAYPNLNAQLAHGVNQVPPMQPDELVSAIARPALQVGLQIDPALVKQILDDMRAAPGALPLMQFALDDLFQYEKSQGGVIALTLEDYLKRGGLEKALTRHADAEFAKLGTDEQNIARAIFTRLIEPGPGNVDTRRTARLQEIVSADANAAQVKPVIAKLADARLVTTDQKDADETVTLAHERLIDAWGWLRKLVDENRDAIALQNQINDDAKEWEQHRRDASYLYVGARLATAQEEVEKKKIALSAVGQEFVQAGTTARQAVRQARQRQRRLVSLAGFAFVILLVNIAYEPIRREFLRQQALVLKPIPISDSKVVLGDARSDGNRADYLPLGSQLVKSFSIEPLEVTNARYLLCIEALACSAPIAFKSSYSDSKYANYPVVNVSAIQASQFCEWLGRRLPTEREWERAARGTAAFPWPWGIETPVPTRSNLYYRGLPAPLVQRVGSYPDDKSSESVFDLAGNVSEWTRSSFDLEQPDWSENDEKLPPTLTIKGGDVKTRPEHMGNTIAYRLERKPLSFDETVGFRCVAH